MARKSLYSKATIDALRAAAEAGGNLPDGVPADATATLGDLALAQHNRLTERGTRVAAALKANGWKR